MNKTFKDREIRKKKKIKTANLTQIIVATKTRMMTKKKKKSKGKSNVLG